MRRAWVRTARRLQVRRRARRRMIIAWLKEERIRIRRERAQRRYVEKHKNQINSVIKKSCLVSFLFMLASIDYCDRLRLAIEEWDKVKQRLKDAASEEQADTKGEPVIGSFPCCGGEVVEHNPRSVRFCLEDEEVEESETTRALAIPRVDLFSTPNETNLKEMLLAIA